MGGHFDVDNITKSIGKLENELSKEDIYNDFDKANKLNQELTELKKIMNNYQSLQNDLETIYTLSNEFTIDELTNEFNYLKTKIDELEINTFLSGEYDKLNCYMEIHPGAGGTESCDWAAILSRMYQRFCEKNNFKWQVIDSLAGEEAGIKSITVKISGLYAYGYLKNETGVHRLVRISPFDSNKRRHTSFAAVSVTPEINNEINIEINENDLKIDVYHSSGAGGQSVNTSNSAVRITHIPTKTVVICQNERSQLKNKEQALKILKSKLAQLEIAKNNELLNSMKNNDLNINFGSQIRNYILEPYKLVKDLRSNYESTNPTAILDGDLKNIIESVLKQNN